MSWRFRLKRREDVTEGLRPSFLGAYFFIADLGRLGEVYVRLKYAA